MALLCRLRTGARLDMAESLRHLPLAGTPVLFIHGQEDSYIEKRMTEEMFRLKQGTKRLYLAPGADHAEAYMKNPDEYDRIVGEFLEEAGI
ncbi:Alpha/beta hydrolase family protein [compost metagenome]